VNQKELEEIATATRDQLRERLGAGSTVIVMLASPPDQAGNAQYYVSYSGTGIASLGLASAGVGIVSRATFPISEK